MISGYTKDVFISSKNTSTINKIPDDWQPGCRCFFCWSSVHCVTVKKRENTAKGANSRCGVSGNGMFYEYVEFNGHFCSQKVSLTVKWQYLLQFKILLRKCVFWFVFWTSSIHSWPFNWHLSWSLLLFRRIISKNPCILSLRQILILIKHWFVLIILFFLSAEISKDFLITSVSYP